MGGSVRLFVPKPVGVNTGILTTSCRRGINGVTTSVTTCSLLLEDPTGYMIHFSNPFAAAVLAVGSYVTLEISGVTNPTSTSPVSSFKIYTYATTSDTTLIAKIESSLSIQMTIPTSLTASYTRDSSKNNDLTNYQFNIKQIPSM